jgi:sulfur relay (sulfurtransferase) complex TusBCD TusD component (DsrE family)
MKSMEPNTAIKLASAAMNKGYGVNLFCYGEGVLAIKEGQAPKRFPNVGKELGELTKKGLKIAVCETCSGARGLAHGEEIEGAKIGSLTKDFVEFLDESDRLITLAR